MEWGINLNSKRLKSKLWFNIFIRVAAIFAVFVAIIMLCNSFLLSKFFCLRQKNALATQIARLEDVDVSDREEVSELLIDIADNYNFDIDIYDRLGNIRYTTQRSHVMASVNGIHSTLRPLHEELDFSKKEKLSGGIIYGEAVRRFDNEEYLLCQMELDSGYFAEVRIQKQLILSSASTANEFISFIAVACLLASLIWVVIFARRFSKPLSQMNEITRDMAHLKFDQTISIDRPDEIGQLAASVNEMSASLSSTLEDLKRTNAKLRDEIELERQLDKMRKSFVANVSHELKTPIAIISGYAEGLKLNINAKNRDEYCDTIIDESRRMNELVLSILELSKYESGQVLANKTALDINELTSVLLNRIFADTSINTSNTIPPQTIVFADKTQIEQALKSYLENAKSHVNSDGFVNVFCEECNNKIRICVHNTGSHIEKEKMPYIWQSFYRGDDSHKRDKSRFGLGLSIVSAVMKMHQNNFGVYNTDDGVCFWLELDKGDN